MRAICACVLLAAGAVQAAGTGQLQARDIDGNGSVDAYFDTGLGVTWLADANYFAQGQPDTGAYPDVGMINMAGSGGQTFPPPPFGLDGWRLPVALTVQDQAECTSEAVGLGLNCVITSSELSELNWGGAPFLNTHPDGNYWLGSRFGDAIGTFSNGHNSVTNESEMWMYAWFVRDGDIGAAVPAIPEPSTYALMVAGLIALKLAFGCSGSRSLTLADTRRGQWPRSA